jgi:FixJ family two-component response regulator
VLIDQHLPNGGGMDLLHSLTADGPATPVVMISRAGSGGLAPDAFRKGATDYVLGRFFEEEQPLVEKSIARAAEAVKCAIDKGVLSAMNLFNKIPES